MRSIWQIANALTTLIKRKTIWECWNSALHAITIPPSCFQSCVPSFLQLWGYLDSSSDPNKVLEFYRAEFVTVTLSSISPGCGTDPHIVLAASRGLVQSQPRVVSAPVLLRPLSGSRAPTPHLLGTRPAQHSAVGGWEGDHWLHGHWITQLSLHY